MRAKMYAIIFSSFFFFYLLLLLFVWFVRLPSHLLSHHKRIPSYDGIGFFGLMQTCAWCVYDIVYVFMNKRRKNILTEWKKMSVTIYIYKKEWNKTKRLTRSWKQSNNSWKNTETSEKLMAQMMSFDLLPLDNSVQPLSLTFSLILDIYTTINVI